MKKFRTIESRNDFPNREAGKTAIKRTKLLFRGQSYFSLVELHAAMSCSTAYDLTQSDNPALLQWTR